MAASGKSQGILVEHHDPVGGSDYLSLQHLERYRFARDQLSAGQRALDIACGVGYGVAMLLERGCEAVGADYDLELVTQARTIWQHNGFVQVDALEAAFQTGSFDAVVSFETIEHVSDDRRFLLEIDRVLRPGGTLIVSTPNIRYTTHPPYHRKEYEPEEFYELIRQHFSQVECYGNYFTLSDRLQDLWRWRVHARGVDLLARIGARSVLRRILRHRRALFGGPHRSSTDAGTPEIERLVRVSGGVDYRVRPFTGEELLRNMVVVARKEELRAACCSHT
jgi:SAM-dependent methyltransferase